MTEPTSYQLAILGALSSGPYHVYEGTVPVQIVAKRRVKNKKARAARRANRGG